MEFGLTGQENDLVERWQIKPYSNPKRQKGKREKSALPFWAKRQKGEKAKSSCNTASDTFSSQSKLCPVEESCGNTVRKMLSENVSTIEKFAKI